MNRSVPVNLTCQRLLLPDHQTVRILRMVQTGLSRTEIIQQFASESSDLAPMVDNAIAMLVAERFLEMTVPEDAIHIALTSKGQHVLNALDELDDR